MMINTRTITSITFTRILLRLNFLSFLRITSFVFIYLYLLMMFSKILWGYPGMLLKKSNKIRDAFKLKLI